MDEAALPEYRSLVEMDLCRVFLGSLNVYPVASLNALNDVALAEVFHPAIMTALNVCVCVCDAVSCRTALNVFSDENRIV